MFMGRDARYWAGVGVAGVVGMAFVSTRPEAYPEHRQQVIEQFHLPDDVEFLMLRSGSRRGGSEYVEATIQLTSVQYQRFAESLDDPQAWSFLPLELNQAKMDAVAEPGWNTWWDGDWAVMVKLDESPFGERVREQERALRKEPIVAIRWVGWGHGHGTGAPEGLSVWKAGRHKSFCWAWAELDGVRAARACNAYPPTSYSPDLTVRALLDEDNARLFVHID